MNAVIFDTLKFSRVLRDKGHFTSEQAETLAEAIGDVYVDGLATKNDLMTVKSELRTEISELKQELKIEISELRQELKVEITELRSELKNDISNLRSEMKTWIISAIGLQTIVVIGALFKLVGH